MHSWKCSLYPENGFVNVPQMHLQIVFIIFYFKYKFTNKGHYYLFQDHLHFKILFSLIIFRKLGLIDQNVTQFDDFQKRSSGSRILRSQFFSGLIECNLYTHYSLFLYGILKLLDMFKQLKSIYPLLTPLSHHAVVKQDKGNYY